MNENAKSFTLVIPFHDADAARLESTLEYIGRFGEGRGISEILLCQNGTAAREYSAILQRAPKWADVRLLQTGRAGVGAGYKLGAAEARGDFLVLSASDLPFGFSDLEAFRKLSEAVDVRSAVGSKLHPESDLSGYSKKRLLASRVFFLVRRMLLGPGVPRDCQGTFIIDRSLMKEISSRELADDFRFTLELSCYVAATGTAVHELPVKYRFHDHDSSVRILRDGTRLVLRTLALRKTIKSLPDISRS